MHIQNFILGDFQTNAYLVRTDENATDCVIIDTGLSSEPLIDHLVKNTLNPVAVVFTHGHADHIAGANLLRENFTDIKVAIHKDDEIMLCKPVKNLSIMTGIPFKTEPADIILEDAQTVEFAGITFQVIHTPGHTPGGICLYCKEEGLVFVGDTLFAGSIGRTDFPGGNHNQLITNIKTKLLTLPPETKVYNGHGPATTIAAEISSNPFLGERYC